MQKLHFTRTQLWQGCILASVAHAVMVRKFPELNFEHSWDGFNYSMNDGMGCRGTITFATDYTVAAFRDDKLRPQPPEDFLDAKNTELIRIADNEALQYLLDDADGETKPVITSAFWGKNEALFAAFDADYLFSRGAALIRHQICSPEDAMAYWTEYYEMEQNEITLTRKLFCKKCNAPDEKLHLDADDLKLLSENGNIHPECLISLSEIGIAP